MTGLPRFGFLVVGISKNCATSTCITTLGLAYLVSGGAAAVYVVLLTAVMVLEFRSDDWKTIRI